MKSNHTSIKSTQLQSLQLPVQWAYAGKLNCQKLISFVTELHKCGRAVTWSVVLQRWYAIYDENCVELVIRSFHMEEAVSAVGLSVCQNDTSIISFIKNCNVSVDFSARLQISKQLSGGFWHADGGKVLRTPPSGRSVDTDGGQVTVHLPIGETEATHR